MEQERDQSPSRSRGVNVPIGPQMECIWCHTNLTSISSHFFWGDFGGNSTRGICCNCKSIFNPHIRTFCNPCDKRRANTMWNCGGCLEVGHCLNMSQKLGARTNCCHCFFVAEPEPNSPYQPFAMYCIVCRTRRNKRERALILYFNLELGCDMPILEALFHADQPLMIRDKFVESPYYNDFLCVVRDAIGGGLSVNLWPPVGRVIRSLMEVLGRSMPTDIRCAIMAHPACKAVVDQILTEQFEQTEQLLFDPKPGFVVRSSEMYSVCVEVRVWIQDNSLAVLDMITKFIDWETKITAFLTSGWKTSKYKQ